MEREHGVFKVCVAWAPAGGPHSAGKAHRAN
jgi:hypothetical protein